MFLWTWTQKLSFHFHFSIILFFSVYPNGSVSLGRGCDTLTGTFFPFLVTHNHQESVESCNTWLFWSCWVCCIFLKATRKKKKHKPSLKKTSIIISNSFELWVFLVNRNDLMCENWASETNKSFHKILFIKFLVIRHLLLNSTALRINCSLIFISVFLWPGKASLKNRMCDMPFRTFQNKSSQAYQIIIIHLLLDRFSQTLFEKLNSVSIVCIIWHLQRLNKHCSVLLTQFFPAVFQHPASHTEKDPAALPEHARCQMLKSLIFTNQGWERC